MSDLVLVTGPASEPVAVADMCPILDYPVYSALDSATQAALTAKLTPLILAARFECEKHCRMAFLPQTWKLTMDHFPFPDMLHAREGDYFRLEIRIPKPPLISITSLQYVDTSGNLQTMTPDTSYGVAPYSAYGSYQLFPGTDVTPARVAPAYASPWPPTRIVAQAVQLVFQCGFANLAAIPQAILTAIQFYAKYLFEGNSQDQETAYCLLNGYRNLCK